MTYFIFWSLNSNLYPQRCANIILTSATDGVSASAVMLADLLFLADAFPEVVEPSSVFFSAAYEWQES